MTTEPDPRDEGPKVEEAYVDLSKSLRGSAEILNYQVSDQFVLPTTMSINPPSEPDDE